MPFDHAAAQAQIAANIADLGQPFVLLAGERPFRATVGTDTQADGLGGTMVVTHLTTARDRFLRIPERGALIATPDRATTYRVAEVRPGPPGHVVITVTAEQP